jgi:ribose-phosphate pyrophosphokinase
VFDFTFVGADRVVSVDLHAPQIQGFVDYPIDNLYAAPIIEDHISKTIIKGHPDGVVVVSPDAGGAKRAERIAGHLNTGVAIFSKKRVNAGEVAAMILVGDVKGKKCILVDDMIDTGGTIVNAAAELKKAGASEVHVAISHGILSASALSRIANSSIDSK